MKKIFLILICLIFSSSLTYSSQNYLKGKFYKSVKNFFLVATNKMNDPRFEKTVILMLENNEHGSWGVVVNKPLGKISLGSLINKIEKEDIEKELYNVEIPVYWGGPVDENKILVLHSKEYKNESTKNYKYASISTSYLTLYEIAKKKGPKKKLIIVGVSSWGDGQLEGEMEFEGWTLMDVNTDLIFEMEDEKKWFNAINNSFIFL